MAFGETLKLLMILKSDFMKKLAKAISKKNKMNWVAVQKDTKESSVAIELLDFQKSLILNVLNVLMRS